ncbi:MAG TPA: PfkB family carbohydrate kinase [Actinomycetota bacterium]|nr:PfkB family carbohydrate kinase [Actinomycetota bacterium]
MRAAVVGHVEWVQFVAVDHVPLRGEILHANEWWEEPGGGGAGAVVQLQKLTGAATFFTAVGDDSLGGAARSFFESQGVVVEAAVRPEPSRRALTFVEPGGERTITVLGARLAPARGDRLAWDALKGADTVYFTAGDEDALRAARAARVLVATTRVLPLLAGSGVYLDAVVGSALDSGESYARGDLAPEPGLAVMTEGEAGGSYWTAGGETKRYAAAPTPGPVVDRYGAGDSFAAGLAYALATGRAPADAVALAARCGAAAVAGRGPYGGQLTGDDVEEEA